MFKKPLIYSFNLTQNSGASTASTSGALCGAMWLMHREADFEGHNCVPGSPWLLFE